MARNIGLAGRRELQAHRRWISGVTASTPRYEEVDTAGNKEWVVDVYIGPLEHIEENIVFSVLIAPYARQLVGDVKQPVLLERSKQGKYTVVGRTKTLAAGTQFEDGDIDEPTFQLIRDNYASLRLRWIPDLDWVRSPFRSEPGQPFRVPGQPFQVIRAFDAFGLQVLGPEAVAPEDFPDGSLPPAPGGTGSPAAARGALYSSTSTVVTTTKHTSIKRSKFGPKGDPDAMVWGVSKFRFYITKTVTT